MSDHDFKVGDRVEVVAEALAFGFYENGDVFTIASIDDDGDLKMVGMTDIHIKPREVRLHAPDVITINRSDLPEVVEDSCGWIVGGFGYSAELTSSQRREHAIRLLALAEFLGVREKAGREAAEKLTKRVTDGRYVIERE